MDRKSAWENTRALGYMNKGIRNEVPDAPINRRPDIMAVRRDGTIDQFEVKSKTDKENLLEQRMRGNQVMMGDRAGTIEVVLIGGPKPWLKQ